MNKIKKVIAGVCCSLCIFAAVGCNHTVFDTEYTFEKAIVCIGGEWQEVEIKKWTDAGDQIQIETKDGYVYLVHSNNITLIHKK